jgi:hypothetical protein
VFVGGIAVAQNRSITGIIKNELGEPLEGVTVKIQNSKSVSQSDKSGYYSIPTSSRNLKISFSSTGYLSRTFEVHFEQGQIFRQDVVLARDVRSLDDVKVDANSNRVSSAASINPALLRDFPTVSGNFESILKTLPGVSSNNELSSQYSVRGGNFDENLVYINDIEIYRPLLVRNGQQEGLSFINPELTSRVSFSAGGFEAKYGDKLSSVLDVRYAQPDTMETVISGGLLGLSASVKSPTNNRKGYYLLGIRDKANQNILKSQETKGTYRPHFYDFQALYGLQINPKLSFSALAGYNLSRFGLTPESRQTTFGTQEKVLQLDVDYEGSEADRYQTSMAALTFLYKASDRFNIKWISSVFDAFEQETFDINGSYIFSEVQKVPGFGEAKTNRGIGSYTDHARNSLNATLYSTELRGYLQQKHSYLQFGTRLERSAIVDKLHEYSLSDSAGYTLPNNPGPLVFNDVVNADNNVTMNKVTAYVQSTYEFSQLLSMLAGVRSSYNSYTSEFLVSPRVSLLYRPASKENLALRFSAGSYNQPPFYRELRNIDGSLNPSARAQRSLHFLTGADYAFTGLGTSLKFTSELYYKKLDKLTPYNIENLRIRYYSDQEAKGYAAGADFSVSGEFVQGLTSSFRLSLMKTEEDIKDDFYLQKDASGNVLRVEPGYLKRPTDQRVNFSIFFQDKLLKSPTYKVHLNVLFGSALPASPPDAERYRDVFKIPAYKRVDIGFSKDFLDPECAHKPAFLKKYFHNVIAYTEVFNLLNINNTVSYLWIKDVDNNQYAIPNYLTSRQLNFKIIAKLKNK